MFQVWTTGWHHPIARRNLGIRLFNNGPNYKITLISTGAGGLGINLALCLMSYLVRLKCEGPPENYSEACSDDEDSEDAAENTLRHTDDEDSEEAYFYWSHISASYPHLAVPPSATASGLANQQPYRRTLPIRVAAIAARATASTTEATDVITYHTGVEEAKEEYDYHPRGSSVTEALNNDEWKENIDLGIDAYRDDNGKPCARLSVRGPEKQIPNSALKTNLFASANKDVSDEEELKLIDPPNNRPDG
ncbi:hypothetical protein BZA05DRAFT_476513 [Tricharina praecox]|uniref:uncharacterized protein n=1 Tax=Tricharina praecox TaxID=43433 RepID=UPI00221ECC36|nr:uncharacterized protein BZA05DRAFT_476513 [Tricharina praecox]KAI5845338.1 hypothetical protein BZA05DRAFT_476513 [Tricharina praecox]